MSFVLHPESPIACRGLVGGEWLIPTYSTQLDVRSPSTGQVTRRWSARTDGSWMS